MYIYVLTVFNRTYEKYINVFTDMQEKLSKSDLTADIQVISQYPVSDLFYLYFLNFFIVKCLLLCTYCN